MDYYEKEYEFVRDQMQSVHGPSCIPRRLLLFINVLSGQGSALNVFIQAAMPYFIKANIRYDVVAVTSPTSGLPIKFEILQDYLRCESLFILSGRISDYIQSMDSTDMDSYDAFVVVGGDGTLGELATGCILFAQRDKQDSSKYPSIQPDSELCQFPKPIGIIPAGSTDAVACTLFGSRDPHIAAIAVSLGIVSHIDIQAVFADGYFAKISLAAVACGFLTDALVQIKRLARLGQIKSLLGLVISLIQFKPYSVAIEYRPRDTSKIDSSQMCSFACSACEEFARTNAKLPKNSALSSKSEWRWASIEAGPIASINAYSSPMRIPGALSYGLAPLCHMNDATAHLFAVAHSGGRLRLLAGLLAGFLGCVDAVYHQKSTFVRVTAIRSCCEYRCIVKAPQNTESVETGMLGSISWNVDGEIIAANAMHAVVHSRLLTFFSTGGPLKSPGIFSLLYFARLAKTIFPGYFLLPTPFKQRNVLLRICDKFEEKWRKSPVDNFMAAHMKFRISSSSVSRLIIVCGFFVLFMILLTIYSISYQASKDLTALSVNRRETETHSSIFPA